jgi:hypothetical protein
MNLKKYYDLDIALCVSAPLCQSMAAVLLCLYSGL